MIDGFVAAALALARAALETGADEAELKKLQVSLPADVFDRIERATKDDPSFIKPARSTQLRETLLIAGIKFVRTPI